jgi:hypothetical protein
MNLLSIEMLLLTLGVSMLVWVFYILLINILDVLDDIKKGHSLDVNFIPHVIITIIGIMLIIISQNI